MTIARIAGQGPQIAVIDQIALAGHHHGGFRLAGMLHALLVLQQGTHLGGGLYRVGGQHQCRGRAGRQGITDLLQRDDIAAVGV